MPKNEGRLQKLQEIVNEVYLVEDENIVELVCASIITHRLPGDPAWLIIVAPSGGGKSEFINAISKCREVWPLSTLTSHTFVSGQKKTGKETSLLHKIGPSGIITFKDFTSLMSEHKDERSVIMAQLREIYDGRYTKSFGTGDDVDWTGKITVLAGSTYAIHSLKASYTAMGERFMMYNMVQPDRKEAARRTMDNQEAGDMAKKRETVNEGFRAYLDDMIEIPTELLKIDKDLQNDLLDLAELATRARSDVERNWRSPQQEITEVHPPEMPTRFAGQLQAFVRALMVISWNETGEAKLLDRHNKILYKLSLDSVTKTRRTAMLELARYNMIETSGLATKLGFPTNTVRRWLEDLNALGIIEREKGSGNKGDRWVILPKYRAIIQKFEGVQLEAGNLTDRVAGDFFDEEDAIEMAKQEDFGDF